MHRCHLVSLRPGRNHSSRATKPSTSASTACPKKYILLGGKTGGAPQRSMGPSKHPSVEKPSWRSRRFWVPCSFAGEGNEFKRPRPENFGSGPKKPGRVTASPAQRRGGGEFRASGGLPAGSLCKASFEDCFRARDKACRISFDETWGGLKRVYLEPKEGENIDGVQAGKASAHAAVSNNKGLEYVGNKPKGLKPLQEPHGYRLGWEALCCWELSMDVLCDMWVLRRCWLRSGPCTVHRPLSILPTSR